MGEKRTRLMTIYLIMVSLEVISQLSNTRVVCRLSLRRMPYLVRQQYGCLGNMTGRTCEILGNHSGLLGCDPLPLAQYVETFRINLMASGSKSMQVTAVGCLKTSGGPPSYNSEDSILLRFSYFQRLQIIPTSLSVARIVEEVWINHYRKPKRYTAAILCVQFLCAACFHLRTSLRYQKQ